MSLTVSNLKRTKFSNLKGAVADITFDDSYPTGGESLTPENLGLSVIDFLVAENAGGYIFEYDRVNKKLKVLTPTAISVEAGEGAADANNTVIKSATGTLEVAGTGEGFSVTNAAAEVANETDLHTLTVRVFTIGW